jgi:hypothetical protein
MAAQALAHFLCVLTLLGTSLVAAAESAHLNGRNEQQQQQQQQHTSRLQQHDACLW